MSLLSKIVKKEVDLEDYRSSPQGQSIFKKLESKVNLREQFLKIDPSIEIKKVIDSEKISYFVMRNKDYHFLKLGPKEKFIVDFLMEGATIEDISYEFFMEYSQLADQYIEHFVNVLYKNNFLIKPYKNIYGDLNLAIRRDRKVSLFSKVMLFLRRKVLKNMVYISSLHKYIDSIYKNGGKFVCSKGATLFFNFSILLSFYVFSTSVNFGNIDIFRVNGSITLGLMVLFLIRAIHTSLHELGHALSVVHFRRKVIKGGLISFFGIPSFFVDTNDIWMRPKKERIMVSFAGPYVNLILNAFAIFLLSMNDNPIMEGFLLRFIAIGALSVFINFNPLLTFDGYFMLIDYIGYPMLRDKAISFIKNFFTRKGHKKIKSMPRKEMLLLSTYGFSSIFWLIFFLAFVLNVMGLRAKELLNELMNSQSYLIKGFSFIFISLFVLPIIISILALIYFKLRDIFIDLKERYWNHSIRNKSIILSSLNLIINILTFFNFNNLNFSIICFLSGFLFFKIQYLKENSHFFIFHFIYIFLLSSALILAKSMIPINLIFLPYLFILFLFVYKQKDYPIFFSYFFVLTLSFNLFFILDHGLKPKLLGGLFFSTITFYYLCSFFLKMLDFNSKFMKDGHIKASDSQKVKIVFENHLHIVYKMMEENYGKFHAKSFIKSLDKKSPEIRIYFEPLSVKYSEKLKSIHSLSSSLKETFLLLKEISHYYFGQTFSQKIFLKILDEEKWVFREVFEEYVLSRNKKGVFDFSLFVENHIQFLSKLDLFSTFNEKDLKLILTNLKSYQFKNGETLTKENEDGDQMFILLGGNVSVYKFSEITKKDEKVAILGPGDIFGERTLFLGEPRSATIITEGEGNLLIMAKDEFKKLLKVSSPFKEKIQKMVDESFKFFDLLKSVPLFKDVSEENLKLLAPKIKFETFEVNDFIFKEGNIGNSFYILKEGKVEIFTGTDDNQTKNILANLGPGEFFGEIALFREIKRTASVKALKKSISLSIAKEDFKSVFSEKKALERVSSRRLKEMNYSVNKKDN